MHVYMHAYMHASRIRTCTCTCTCTHTGYRYGTRPQSFHCSSTEDGSATADVPVAQCHICFDMAEKRKGAPDAKPAAKAKAKAKAKKQSKKAKDTESGSDKTVLP